MTDEMTRAIAEALGCRPGGIYDRDESPPQPIGTWCVRHGQPRVSQWPCPEAERITAVLAPLIEARVREARARALTDAAEAWTQGAWASTPRHKDRVADRMAAAQYAGDWLRERAEEVRRG